MSFVCMNGGSRMKGKRIKGQTRCSLASSALHSMKVGKSKALRSFKLLSNVCQQNNRCWNFTFTGLIQTDCPVNSPND